MSGRGHRPGDGPVRGPGRGQGEPREPPPRSSGRWVLGVVSTQWAERVGEVAVTSTGRGSVSDGSGTPAPTAPGDELVSMGRCGSAGRGGRPGKPVPGGGPPGGRHRAGRPGGGGSGTAPRRPPGGWPHRG